MKVLVVFYSRTGTTKKVAERIAEELKSNGVEVALEEIVEKERRSGFLGWIRACKDATLRRPAEIEPVKANPADFWVVVLGTPVWAWTLTPAVRTFLMEHAASCERVAFFCTMGSSGAERAFRTMEELAGKAPLATLALIARYVKSDDEEKFLAKVKEFSKAVAQAGS